MKTSELIGPALDWAVELALGTHWSEDDGYFVFENPERFDPNPEYRYSTDWAQAGPIIEWAGMIIAPISVEGQSDLAWEVIAYDRFGAEFTTIGSPLLIAAMRCYCCTKLGTEIELPEGLR